MRFEFNHGRRAEMPGRAAIGDDVCIPDVDDEDCGKTGVGAYMDWVNVFDPDKDDTDADAADDADDADDAGNGNEEDDGA
jgi:hypothetical protein